MTCRGYDPRAVKIAKPIKRMAATILDDHKRGSFIRSYVAIAESELRGARQSKDKQSK